ncbi:hypothetical protein [Buttiauxella sp.]|uniref:hypothetical protein n=1 Tax=Buttiauxella sp. TaxID=1972222 RepID=UPI003C739F18
MSNFDKAVELINSIPLPDDAEEQLDALAADETDEFERYKIASLGEALFETRHCKK